MAKEIYNLQVPIDVSLANTLKQLADEDDRTLRAYCKRILQDHVKNLGKEISNSYTISKDIVQENEVTQETEQSIKKKKVGQLIKK